MKWLAVTLCLLLASMGLVGWIYLRDRDAGAWQPPERALARADAVTAFDVMGGGPGCDVACNVELVSRLAPRRWLARMTIHASTRCVEIRLDAFSTSEAHGLLGVVPAGCPAPQASAATRR
jgi:hypothetical protein